MRLQSNVIKRITIGSRVTCKPIPKNADYDFLILVSNMARFEAEILAEGFVKNSDDYGDSPDSELLFVNFKKDINREKHDLIVTDKPDFYNKFELATDIAKALNLTIKEHRIELFKGILYNWQIGATLND